jgi:hypothetical protein
LRASSFSAICILEKPQLSRARTIDFVLFGLTVFLCVGTILAHFSRPPCDLPAARQILDPSLQSITCIDAAARHVRVCWHCCAKLIAITSAFD